MTAEAQNRSRSSGRRLRRRLVRCELGDPRVSASIDAPHHGHQTAAWSEWRGLLTAEVLSSRLWVSSERELSVAPEGVLNPSAPPRSQNV